MRAEAFAGRVELHAIISRPEPARVARLRGIRGSVRRCLLFAILALIMADASGLVAFAVPEPCAVASETDQGPDRCPGLCARCACCTLPVLQSATVVQATPVPRRTVSAAPVHRGLPAGHVSRHSSHSQNTPHVINSRSTRSICPVRGVVCPDALWWRPYWR
jgi:hypothetical protein